MSTSRSNVSVLTPHPERPPQPPPANGKIKSAPGMGGGLLAPLPVSTSTPVARPLVSSVSMPSPSSPPGAGIQPATSFASSSHHLQPLQAKAPSRVMSASQSIPLHPSSKNATSVILRPRTTGAVPTNKAMLNTPRQTTQPVQKRKMSLTPFAPWDIATFTSPLPPLGMHAPSLDCWGDH